MMFASYGLNLIGQTGILQNIVYAAANIVSSSLKNEAGSGNTRYKAPSFLLSHIFECLYVDQGRVTWFKFELVQLLLANTCTEAGEANVIDTTQGTHNPQFSSATDDITP